MTTELVLLLCLSVFVSAGAFFSEKGPFKVFEHSGPRLGARLEQNIAVGHTFNVYHDGGGPAHTEWYPPSVKPPNGQL